MFLRLTSRAIPVLKSDINRKQYLPIQFHEDKLDCAVKIFKSIVDCADIYYGIRSGQLSEALTDKVVSTIIRDYSELSVEDIEYAFERYRKEKTDWRNITFDEIMAPIKQFHRVKYSISKERLQMEKEQQELQERIKKENEFLQKSIELFYESQNSDYYLGDVFHARKIYGYFLSHIPEDTLQELQEQANKESKQVNDMINSDFITFAITPERLYAVAVVNYAIKNKIPLNQI